MKDGTSTTKILHADPEHGGIRFAALLTIAVGLIGGYFLMRLLLEWLASDSPLLDFATVISCIGAVPIALGFSWLVEHFLRKNWSSGMRFELTGSELHFERDASANGSPLSIAIDFDQRVNLTCWFFKLIGYPKAGRERLVSDKWLCLACQMQQDDKRLIAFTYVPPEKAQEWFNAQNLDEPFHEISLTWLYREAGKRRLGATTRPEIPVDMLTGPDGRYWIAERRRWEEGLELSEDDFVTLIDFVEQNTASEVA